MKLMNKETFINDVKGVVDEINKKETETRGKDAYVVRYKADTDKEKDGVLGVVLSLKGPGRKDKTYMVPVYVIESYHRVEVIVINNRTCKVLFENSTMNSPKIVIPYLKDILLKEIGFIEKLKLVVPKKPARKPYGKPGFNKGKFNKDSKGGYNKNNGEKKDGGYHKDNKSYGDNRNQNSSKSFKNSGRPYKKTFNTEGKYHG